MISFRDASGRWCMVNPDQIVAAIMADGPRGGYTLAILGKDGPPLEFSVFTKEGGHIWAELGGEPCLK